MGPKALRKVRRTVAVGRARLSLARGAFPTAVAQAGTRDDVATTASRAHGCVVGVIRRDDRARLVRPGWPRRAASPAMVRGSSSGSGRWCWPRDHGRLGERGHAITGNVQRAVRPVEAVVAPAPIPRKALTGGWLPALSRGHWSGHHGDTGDTPPSSPRDRFASGSAAGVAKSPEQKAVLQGRYPSRRPAFPLFSTHS